MPMPSKEQEAGYEEGFYDGFQNAKERIAKFLKRFPLQTAALISTIERLHPSQPDEDER